MALQLVMKKLAVGLHHHGNTTKGKYITGSCLATDPLSWGRAQTGANEDSRWWQRGVHHSNKVWGAVVPWCSSRLQEGKVINIGILPFSCGHRGGAGEEQGRCASQQNDAVRGYQHPSLSSHPPGIPPMYSVVLPGVATTGVLQLGPHRSSTSSQKTTVTMPTVNSIVRLPRLPHSMLKL